MRKHIAKGVMPFHPCSCRFGEAVLQRVTEFAAEKEYLVAPTPTNRFYKLDCGQVAHSQQLHLSALCINLR